MTFKVLTTPKDDAILRKISKNVNPNEISSSVFQNFLDELIKTMKIEDGAGIAAPQVGKNIRVIIIDTSRGPRAYINPVITERSQKMTNSTEGCLSVPNKYGVVSRHKKISIQALDRNGKIAHIKKSGLLATVFQHEIDHLDGVLFIDKADEIYEN